MAYEMSLDIAGLEELERDLTKAIKKCPVQAKETLNQLGNDFRKSGRKRGKAKLRPHKRTAEQKNKSINAKWGKKVVDDSLGMTVLVYNSAKHFHLIENGHNMVNKNGQTVDFIRGYHIMEETKNEYQSIVPERFQEMVDDILKGCDLD